MRRPGWIFGKRMKDKIGERHLQKLALITEVPLEKLVEFDTMGLLDDERVVDLVLMHDYRSLRRSPKKYTKRQCVMALAKEYNLKESRVGRAVSKRRTGSKYCKECGAEVTPFEYSRNDGICDVCVVNKIVIEEE